MTIPAHGILSIDQAAPRGALSRIAILIVAPAKTGTHGSTANMRDA
jgi:hypothetical protein